MIGVIADPAEHDVVREFFELFKTPWEFYRRGRTYDLLLCAADDQIDEAAKLVVLYAGRRILADDTQKIKTNSQRTLPTIFTYQGNRIPIYSNTVTFPQIATDLLVDDGSHEAAAYLAPSDSGVTVRIGYDLFGEVRKLLTTGQPPANADMPALELHIALLRDLITGCGIPLVEIPPVPDGYRFIVCLTHDVDHPSISRHKCDHTMLGFLYRAVFGSFRQLLSGRINVRNLLRNWAAVVKLPFVYLGLAKDFWSQFAERYLELEKGLRSTFFVIPFKDCPGGNGPAPAFRAARYGAADIADTIRKLTIAGSEVGLHGIDAWVDSARACAELEEIRRTAGASEVGVRIHWLYYDQQSPMTLDQAGAAYDSSIGYNETVGYRAGTTQAYKPLQATRLLELPLHVMDTALFYPSYLALSPQQATAAVARLTDDVARFGGCLTINWHDRSLAPERLWDACYRNLLQDLKSRGAWFSTAGQATCWFRKRRSVVFEADCRELNALRARVAADNGDHLPGLRLRTHKSRGSCVAGAPGARGYVDAPFEESAEARVFDGVAR